MSVILLHQYDELIEKSINNEIAHFLVTYVLARISYCSSHLKDKMKEVERLFSISSTKCYSIVLVLISSLFVKVSILLFFSFYTILKYGAS
jgi:translation initiation factor 2 beta subunit (eIF-2beta)/eIF-5